MEDALATVPPAETTRKSSSTLFAALLVVSSLILTLATGAWFFAALGAQGTGTCGGL